jgi:hypothetical protein
VKLILQIALGVFLGALASQFVFDTWHTYQESIAKAVSEKLRAEQEKVRLEQNERIRALFIRGSQPTPSSNKPPPGFVPDDSRMEAIKQE